MSEQGEQSGVPDFEAFRLTIPVDADLSQVESALGDMLQQFETKFGQAIDTLKSGLAEAVASTESSPVNAQDAVGSTQAAQAAPDQEGGGPSDLGQISTKISLINMNVGLLQSEVEDIKGLLAGLKDALLNR